MLKSTIMHLFNLLEKYGFEFECIRKSFIKEDNLWTDRKIYTKIL